MSSLPNAALSLVTLLRRRSHHVLRLLNLAKHLYRVTRVTDVSRRRQLTDVRKETASVGKQVHADWLARLLAVGGVVAVAGALERLVRGRVFLVRGVGRCLVVRKRPGILVSCGQRLE